MKFLGGLLTGLVLAVVVVAVLVAALDLVITEKNDTVTVPDVTEMRPNGALSQLTAVGLTGHVVKQPGGSNPYFSLLFKGPPPVVREQFPTPGAEVAPQTDVTLHVR